MISFKAFISKLVPRAILKKNLKFNPLKHYPLFRLPLISEKMLWERG